MTDTLLPTAAGWLATYVVHSTILIGCALLVARWAKAPAHRERLWKLALTASLITATAAHAYPRFARLTLSSGWPALATSGTNAPSQADAWAASSQENTAQPSPSANQTDVLSTATAEPSQPESPAIGARRDVGPASASATSPLPPWSSLVVWIWFGTACVLLSIRAVSWRRLVRTLDDRTEVREGSLPAMIDRLCRAGGLSRLVRVTVADNLPTPVVLSPHEICLPRRLIDGLPDAQLRAVVAHELAHIRRRDPTWLRFCTLLECLLFVQPLHRLARVRLFESAEMLCDDWATHQTGERLELAEGLAKVASWLGPHAVTVPKPCLGEERAPLLERVKRLLAPGAVVATPRPWATAAALAIVAVAMACAGPSMHVELGSTSSAYDEMPLEELLHLSEQANWAVGQRLLALPDDYGERHADLLALPGAHAIRLLLRGLTEITPIRGGGAYYSFVSKDHDYNREPDLQYANRQFRTGFYGGNSGHVLDLGVVPLEAIDLYWSPEALPNVDSEAFRLMTQHDASTDEERSSFKKALSDICRGEGLRRPGRSLATAGHTYLLRAILSDEHDVLVTFTVTDQDAESVLLVYRVLKTFPMKRTSTLYPPVGPRLSETQDWIAELDLPALRKLKAETESVVEHRLFGIPDDLRLEHTTTLALEDSGIARILERSHKAITWIRGHGAYYSFTRRSHSYDDAPDLELNQGNFSSGFSGGNTGALLDLGPVALTGVTRTRRPAWLDEDQVGTWGLLTTTVASRTEADVDAWIGDIRDLKIHGVPAVVGHTYLLRSVMPDDHDVLVAFRTVAADEYGMTFVWKQLERWY